MKRFRKRKSWLTLPKKTKVVYGEAWFSRQIFKGKQHFTGWRTAEGPQRPGRQLGERHKLSDSLGPSGSAAWQAGRSQNVGAPKRMPVGS